MAASSNAPEIAVNVAKPTVCHAAFVFLDITHPSQGFGSVMPIKTNCKV